MSDDQKQTTESEWYTPKDVGKLFGLDPKTIIRWDITGKLKAHKVTVIRTLGGHRRYSKEDIDRLYQELNPKDKSGS